jgi:hypothetical protein
MLLQPYNIDDLIFARAALSGMAALGLLHARFVENIDMISEAGNLTDWRDPFQNDFLAAIRTGNIRLDGRWSKGPDYDLVNFANASEEKARDVV